MSRSGTVLYGDRRPPERFWVKVSADRKTGCWVWIAGRDCNGYGEFKWKERFGRRRPRAHRVAYEVLVGEVRSDLVIDHLCRNPSCVNPAHLEAVSHYENMARSPTEMGQRAAKPRGTATHCKHGHEFTVENTYLYRRGSRDCRECHRQKGRRLYWASKGALDGRDSGV